MPAEHPVPLSAAPPLSTLHPLEPLTAEEITSAVQIVCSERQPGDLVHYERASCAARGGLARHASRQDRVYAQAAGLF